MKELFYYKNNSRKIVPYRMRRHNSCVDVLNVYMMLPRFNSLLSIGNWKVKLFHPAGNWNPRLRHVG